MKLLAFVVLLGALRAQPVFEVASVKPANAGMGVRGGCHGVDSRYAPNEVSTAPPLGRCVISDGRLSHMLWIAYRLRSMSSIRGGPDWVMTGDDRFNVVAKAENPDKATEAQLLEMLQGLLIERFQIKLHKETKEVHGFALVVAKNGPKFRVARGDEVDMTVSPYGKPAPNQQNTLTAKAYSMPLLADFLTMFGQPVLDKTSLPGAYDFKMTWNDAEGPTLSTALQEQLGLKFEARKVPVSTIVIDSAQKPGEN